MSTLMMTAVRKELLLTTDGFLFLTLLIAWNKISTTKLIRQITCPVPYHFGALFLVSLSVSSIGISNGRA